MDQRMDRVLANDSGVTEGGKRLFTQETEIFKP